MTKSMVSHYLKTHLISVVLILCSTTAFAETQIFETPISKTKVVQTEALKSRAEKWDISKTEYQRFQTLMRGPLGKWNPNIDPLLALGMFANSRSDQTRYAQLYAKQEFDLTQKALIFQASYRDAFERLFPGRSIVDSQKLAPYFKHKNDQALKAKKIRAFSKQLRAGDRLLAFFPQQCDRCLSSVSRLLKLVQGTPEVTLSIYIVGAAVDVDVHNWITRNRVNKDWFKEGTTSINRDEGLLQRLKVQSKSPFRLSHPIYLLRDNRYFEVNLKGVPS